MKLIKDFFFHFSEKNISYHISFIVIFFAKTITIIFVELLNSGEIAINVLISQFKPTDMK